MTVTLSKINPQHLTRTAYIYIRQSTLTQVRFNQESTERQYNPVSCSNYHRPSLRARRPSLYPAI